MATDSFDRTDNSDLGANWTQPTGHGSLQIVSNKVRAQTADMCVELFAGTFTNNHFAQVVLKTIGVVFTGAGPVVRGGANGDCYLVTCNTVDGIRLMKWTGGSFTSVLGTYTATAPAVNDTIKLDSSGTTLTVYQNGNSRISVTDSSFASGSPGACIESASVGDNEFDDFECTNALQPIDVADAALTRLNAGDAFLKNALYLGDPDTTAEPDSDKCGPASIMKLGERDYRCWYEGVTPIKTLDVPNQTGTFDYDTVTCYATSPDGLVWAKRDNNSNGITDTIISVVITPTNPASGSLAWMRGESAPGAVVYDTAASLWKMWGHGGNNTGPRAIFYATSTDGLAWTFQNTGQPVLEKGTSGAWDGKWVADARVIHINASSYLMLYRGTPVSGMPQIGLATSTDGVTWTKFASNPVLVSGASGAWDDQAIYPAGLVYDGRRLRCWYGGDGTGDIGGQGLGYAQSDNLGETWVKGMSNPVLSLSASGLDSISIGDTIGAYMDGATYRVHYSSEKDVPPYFRGRLLASVNGVAPITPSYVKFPKFRLRRTV